MTTEAFDIGDTRYLIATFTDSAGSASDPTEITFTLRKPDGTSISYAYSDSPSLITKTATGVYRVDFAITLPGRHVFRWAGTGASAVVEAGEFYARRNEAA
jgi:hypothetical protein